MLNRELRNLNFPGVIIIIPNHLYLQVLIISINIKIKINKVILQTDQIIIKTNERKDNLN